METKSIIGVDYLKVAKLLWSYRKIFFIALPLTFVLSSAIILCVPRSYTSKTKLVPEFGFQDINSISSLASSFGIDIGSSMISDAISPNLYPDLLESNEFLCRLSQVEVADKNGQTLTAFAHYEYWKHPFFDIPSYFKSRVHHKGTLNEDVIHNALRLDEHQDNVIKVIRKKITCSTDKKTNVISISVEAQDPCIAAQLAEEASKLIQSYIIEYRTKKAAVDVEYYNILKLKKKAEAEAARKAYADYYDSHINISRESTKTRIEALRDEAELFDTAYKNAEIQYQGALARLQERTPVFTVLQGAVLPVKPSKPKRVLFVISMMVLVTFGIGIGCLKDLIINNVH